MATLTVLCPVKKHKGQRRDGAFGAVPPVDAADTLTLPGGGAVSRRSGVGFHALRCADMAAALGLDPATIGAAPVAASDAAAAIAASPILNPAPSKR